MCLRYVCWEHFGFEVKPMLGASRAIRICDRGFAGSTHAVDPHARPAMRTCARTFEVELNRETVQRPTLNAPEMLGAFRVGRTLVHGWFRVPDADLRSQFRG